MYFIIQFDVLTPEIMSNNEYKKYLSKYQIKKIKVNQIIKLLFSGDVIFYLIYVSNFIIK